MVTGTSKRSPTQTDGQDPEPILARIGTMTWNVHQARVAVMAMLGTIPKAGTNKDQGYSYGTTEDIRDRLRPAMAACGLTMTPTEVERQHDQLQGRKRADGSFPTVHRAEVTMEYVLEGPDKTESKPMRFGGVGLDYGDKALSKAYTAAWKAWVREAFNIAFSDDAEAEAQDIEVEPSAQRSAPRRETPQRQPAQRGQRPHWADWGSKAAYQRAEAGLASRRLQLPDMGRAAVDMLVDRLGYEWGWLTREQFGILEGAIKQEEDKAAPPADTSTGEHDDRHDLTDDHEHDPDTTSLDFTMPEYPRSSAHVHPEAHAAEPHSRWHPPTAGHVHDDPPTDLRVLQPGSSEENPDVHDHLALLEEPEPEGWR